jgi:hypothetical protein
MKENLFLVALAIIMLIGFIIEWRIQGKLRKEDEERQKRPGNRQPIKIHN